MNLEFWQIVQGVVAALLVGFSKTGVVGMGILIAPLMAGVAPKEFLGWLLPMLIFGDLFAVVYYRRHAQWGLLLRLFPWVLPGLAIGYFVLRAIPKQSLQPLLGWLVLTMIVLNEIRERRAVWIESHVPRRWWFSAIMGFLAGFATTVGSVAGPIMSVYLISTGLKKREFMGTGAWYYLIFNCLKIPIYGSLGFITRESLTFNLWVAPVIAAGAFFGIFVFNRIPQAWFNHVIKVLAALASIRLILS